MKRILSAALALVFTVTLAPLTVFAGEVDGFYYVDDGDAGISHSPKLLLLS